MIKVDRFNKYEKGNLKGFADIIIPRWGIIIKGIGFFEKDSAEWVSLPGNEVIKDGESKRYPFLKFIETEDYQRFQKETKEAIKMFINGVDNEAPF